MTVRSTPIFIQGNSHPGEETRLMMAGILGASTGSFSGGVAAADPAHGIVNTTDLAVTQNGTPNMSVNVAAGGAFIRGTQSANQGVYHLWNDATLNVTIAASDPTNARRDLVIAQVRDAYYSGSDRDARITVVTGTAAASPVDPSLSAYPNALVLARVTVAAASTTVVTANITNLRTLADISGRLPVFTSAAAAATAMPSPADGQGYYLNTGTATEGVQFWNGSAYRLPWNMPWGEVASGASNTTATTTGTTEATIKISPSFTAVANRKYRVQLTGTVTATIAGAVYEAYLRDNALAGTLLGFTRFTPPGNDHQINLTILGTGTLAAAGTRSVYFTLKQLSGTGVGGSLAGVALYWSIEDIGPAGVPA